MQIYFFNFFNGTKWLKDEIGQSLTSQNEISREIKIALVEMSAEFFLCKDIDLIAFCVTDKDGNLIQKTTLSLKEERFEPTLCLNPPVMDPP